ncbi:MAG TPA: hypothetical protein VG324_28425 [Blastocatellia bacterium]|nr:hypothetical protein [Blastocatellia bacterium]
MRLYRQKPLRVHSLLAGIPLRTLERVELYGGREGVTIEEISGVVGFGGEAEMEVGPVTQALFRLRTLIGRILGWDEANGMAPSARWPQRGEVTLPASDRQWPIWRTPNRRKQSEFSFGLFLPSSFPPLGAQASSSAYPRLSSFPQDRQARTPALSGNIPHFD